MMSIACNIPHCGGFYEHPGVLAAHLVSEHGSLPHIALIGARSRFGLETVPPAPGFAPPRERVLPRRQRGCLWCARTQAKYATPCAHHGGPTHGTSARHRRERALVAVAR